jgi:hypothetical protein
MEKRPSNQSWPAFCYFHPMKMRLLFFLLIFPVFLLAQKKYLVHLTMDKIILGTDSMVFKNGKNWLIETTGKADTIEVAKVKSVPVAIVIDIRKVKMGEQIKTQIGYAFLKKVNNKWELIRHFGYTDRYNLLAPRPGFESTAKKKPASEEYHCQLGQPQQFEAWFRMDCYVK